MSNSVEFTFPGQGPPGVPSVAVLGAAFIMPAVGTLTSGPFVTISAGNFPNGSPSSFGVAGGQVFPIGSTITIAGAGTNGQAGSFLVAAAPTPTTMQIVNNGSPQNVAEGVTVPAGGGIGPSGATGATGAQGPGALTTLRTAFVQPSSGAQTSTLTFDSTAEMAVGFYVQVQIGGIYTVFSIASSTQAVLTNTGASNNATPGNTIPEPAQVGPSGPSGFSGTLPVQSGGTGQTTLASHGVLLGEGTSGIGSVPIGASGLPLVSQGSTSDPTFAAIGVAAGGTGQVTLTAHAVMIGEGTGSVGLVGPSTVSGLPLLSQGAGLDPQFTLLPISSLTPGTAGQIPITNSSATSVVMESLSQDLSITPAGVASVQGATIPASIANPTFQQLQATGSAEGQVLRLASQPAGTTAGTTGAPGQISLLLGEPSSTNTDDCFIWFGHALTTNLGTVSERAPSNYFNYAFFFWNPSTEVVHLQLGGGNNGNGGGVTAVEISADCEISIATEANGSNVNALINLSPLQNNALAGVSGARANFNAAANVDGNPLLQLYPNAGTPGSMGYVNNPWGHSSSFFQDILDQHSNPLGFDLPIISRLSAVLTFGSFVETAQVHASNLIKFRVIQTGTGFQFANQSPTGATDQTQFTIASDNQASLVQGDILAGTNDARISQIYSANTSATTANQVVAAIPIRSGTEASVYVRIVLQGRNPANGDMASFTLSGLFVNNAGTITQVGTTTTIDSFHTSGAGSSIAPAFAISGSNLEVEVTPWTATALHWTVMIDQFVNMGAATAPAAATPPGSPAGWWNADKQATGTTNSLTDQSGNSYTLNRSGTAQTNTAGAGPNGSQNAFVMAGTGYYGIASALGIGANNFTIAVIAKSASTGSQNCWVNVGQTNGVYIGVDNQGAGARDITNGATGASFGSSTATTNWEAWILTVDSNGNIDFRVNGVPQNGFPACFFTAPGANFQVGAIANGTQVLTGDLYEVIIWTTAQDPAAVYAYQHAVTGL